MRTDQGEDAVEDDPPLAGSAGDGACAPEGDVAVHDVHGSHDHVSLLYRDADDLFESVVPLVREGLDGGERCLYVHHDNDRSTVVESMRAGGIDVEAAVESGALSFQAATELYGEDAFDADEVIERVVTAARRATEDGDYDGVRIFGELSWALEEDSRDQLLAYEQRLAAVFADEPLTGVCLYGVERFDAEFLNNVLRAHPHAVYTSATAGNVYYLPAGDSLVGDAETPDERTRTLRERVTAAERLERRERALRELDEATRALLYVDADALPDRAAELARDVLGVSFASCWCYDDRSGELAVRASSSELGDTTALAERFRDEAWEAFVSEELVAVEDLDEASGPLESGVIVPLGRHGVFCVGATDPGAFDDVTVKLASMLGRDVEAALDRAERERTIVEKNAQLERVNMLNSVIRELSEALVTADDRSEIERIVCERLANADAYRFAWVGGRNGGDAEMTTRAAAGDHRGYLDEALVTADDGEHGKGPMGRAVATHEPQVVGDVLTDPSFAPWREAALDAGFRSCITVPLVYDDLCYGVLAVYADEPNGFDDEERAVLGDLGRLIGHAIDAAETRETLRAERVVELTFSASPVEDPLARLAAGLDGDLRIDGVVATADEATHLFFDVEGADVEAVRSRGEDLPGIDEPRVVGEDAGGATFRATVTVATLASRVVEQQAVLRSLTVADGEATVVVDLPSSADVRAFLADLRTDYDAVELRSHRTLDRPVETGQGVRDTVEERLTPRQREVLETAYRSGFFESPRRQTGRELSASLDISQSTFTYHLRGAERALCELVFEER